MSSNNKSGLRGRYWDTTDKQQKKLLAEIRRAQKTAGVIAMIDMGQIETPGGAAPTRHKDFPGGKLKERKALKYKPASPSKSGHAMEVAGILDELCDAEIRHYNVWDDGELDPQALLAALTDVATSGDVAVLNLSIGIDPSDPTLIEFKTPITTAIDDCIKAGVFVVAGVGESTPAPGSPSSGAAAFPANLSDADKATGVISVSAVNAYNRPITDSAKGALFSAPGEGVDVMIDAAGYRKQDGSSYATPYMSACIWLALAANPALAPKTVNGANPRAGQAPMRTLLVNSSRPNPPTTPASTSDQTLQAQQRGSNGTIDIKQLALSLGIPV